MNAEHYCVQTGASKACMWRPGGIVHHACMQTAHVYMQEQLKPFSCRDFVREFSRLGVVCTCKSVLSNAGMTMAVTLLCPVSACQGSEASVQKMGIMTSAHWPRFDAAVWKAKSANRLTPPNQCACSITSFTSNMMLRTGFFWHDQAWLVPCNVVSLL